VSQSRVIGLDIGTTAVRAAEVEFGKGGPSGKQPGTLVAFGEVNLPPGAVRDGEVAEPAAVASALRELWGAAKFSSKDVVLGIGNQRVIVREIDLPWLPPAELKASLPFHVQELLPVASTDALLDYYTTGVTDTERGRMVNGMLVAAQRDTIAANVVAVESAGLRPTMVDLNGFALLRALVRGQLADGIVGLVEIGARGTTVVVADRGVPRLVRMIAVGGQNVTDAVARSMQMAGPDAEALKRQLGLGFAPAQGQELAVEAIAEVSRALVESIRNTFVFYGTNHPGAQIDVVALTGGGAMLPGFGQYLSSSLRLPVVVGDALAGVRTGKVPVAGRESRMALPIGLAHGVAA